jgi:translocator protein
MIAIWPHVRWIALVNIPYLIWVLFVTILQVTITILNK